MEKIWYILMDGKKEGPYSIFDLMEETRLSPDTLVWKEGFEDWVSLKEVPELQSLFEEPAPEVEEEVEEPLPVDEELTLQVEEPPPPFLYYFIFVVVIITVYFLIKLYL